MPGAPAANPPNQSLPPRSIEVQPTPEPPRSVEIQPAAPQPEGPGVGGRILDRFLGTDVEDDPLELPRLGTTIAGGIGGAILGAEGGAMLGGATGPAAPVAVPVLGVAGGLLGGAGGAFAGAMAPEMAIEVGEEMGLVKEGTRDKIGLSPEELKTVAEGEALLDLATGGGLTILRAGGRFTGRLFTGARKDLAEKLARIGVDMTPVQVGDRVIGRGFVSVFGRFPLLGGGAIRRKAGKAEEQLKEVIVGLSKRVGPLTDASALSTQIFSDAKTLVKETNGVFKGKYERIFARADEMGVQVVPKETLTKADEILKKLFEGTPKPLVGEGKPGPALEKLRTFLEEEIKVLRAETTGGIIYSKQSLKQMDGLISKIDQEIATLEPGQKRFALSLLNQLRQAAQRDVLINTRGVGADEIGRALREVDAEFSHTMSQLFETATAKRFGSVERRGLRAVEFDRTTRTPVDQLARIVVNLNSPQAIDELSRLITPETLQRVTAHTIDTAVEMAMKTDGFAGHFNVDKFASRLGLDGTNEARRETIRIMLERSGSEVTIQDLDDIVLGGKLLAGFDLPNVSSFIARRGTIGGLQSIINGVVPGLALLGGSGAAAGYTGSTLVGTIMFVGGSHMFSRIIANPKTSRALHKVFDKEISSAIRKKAFVSAVRGGLEVMRDEGEITNETYTRMIGFATNVLDALERQYESMKGN